MHCLLSPVCPLSKPDELTETGGDAAHRASFTIMTSCQVWQTYLHPVCAHCTYPLSAGGVLLSTVFSAQESPRSVSIVL
jgi:hypothetical protein